ncbi:MAG TPA: hypothetical protein VMU53_19015 [Candidatus Sulfotelmatobacter sp.]|nr:hypothetical protein [Candidatus Sulfotelmatobacter sp.]
MTCKRTDTIHEIARDYLRLAVATEGRLDRTKEMHHAYLIYLAAREAILDKMPLAKDYADPALFVAEWQKWYEAFISGK